jgi:hypothetical protein
VAARRAPSGSEISKFIGWANALPSRLDQPAVDGMFIYLAETAYGLHFNLFLPHPRAEWQEVLCRSAP